MTEFHSAQTHQSNYSESEDAFNIGNFWDRKGEDFTNLFTKVKRKIDQNSTKGWVTYATENSNYPPKVKFIAKLIRKAYQKPEKMHKFYASITQLNFSGFTIIALKSLCLLHKYILYGPERYNFSHPVLDDIHESWAGNIMLKKKSKKDKYRSENFANLICLYARILKMKLELYSNNWDFVRINFSLIAISK
jgi:hypothetical protein